MFQVPAYKLGEKEEEMMEPKRVETKSSKLYNFDFESFDDKVTEALETIYPENPDERKGYIMLCASHGETFPMGVILYKAPESDIEKEAFRAHLRKFIENFDE